MNALEKAEQLRQEAIKELLNEKKRIEEMLKMIGYNPEGKVAGKKRNKAAMEENNMPVSEPEGQVAAVMEA